MPTMSLSTLAKAYNALTVKKNLTGKKAMKAVQQNSDALCYVNSDLFKDCGISVERTADDVIAELPEADRALVLAEMNEK